MGPQGGPERRRSGPAVAVGAALVVGVALGLAAGAPPRQRVSAAAGILLLLAVWTPLTGLLLVRSRRLQDLTETLGAELSRRKEPEILALSQLEEDLAAVRAIVDGATVTMVVQPIVWLPTNEVVGYEALARFPDGLAPPTWFERAERCGLGLDLELCCIRGALELLDDLPPDTYLSLNVSPDTLTSDQLADLLDREGSHRVVLELTEHVPVNAYERYVEVVRLLRRRGVRLAVDDAGAGFSSLRHVVSLGPDIVKLDRSLVADIDHNSLQRSLVHGLASFARATKTSLVAEGVETAGEARALVEEGVAFAQGYWFARPQAVTDLGGKLVVGTPLTALHLS